MGAKITLDRTVLDTSEVEQSTSKFNGWDLNITVNRQSGEVRDINLYGTKGDDNVSASYGSNGYTQISFSNISAKDNDLYVAIMNEFEALTSTEE